MKSKSNSTENKQSSSKEKMDPAKDKKVETIKIGDITFYFPYSDLWPSRSDSEFESFCDRIGVMGIHIPIVVDEKFNVIDGKDRLKAAVIKGITSIPWDFRPFLSENEKIQLAIDLNLHRRLADAVVTNETAPPDTIIGKDQKKRSAKAKPKQKPRIAVNTLKDLHKAIDACNVIGCDNLPNKPITLRRLQRIAREEEKKRQSAKECTDFKVGKSELLFGDFRERENEIPAGSAAMVFTDPPYGKEYLPLYSDLAKFADRVLKPSGLLLTHASMLYLPQVLNMLGEYLTWVWPGAIYHSGGKNLIPAANVFQGWKPILIYQKLPKKIYWKPFTDIVSGGESKKNHDWEQSVDEAVHYIKALCPQNGILIDPMMGSGTSILAGLKCGVKHCIGIDSDPVAFSTTEERVNRKRSPNFREQR